MANPAQKPSDSGILDAASTYEVTLRWLQDMELLASTLRLAREIIQCKGLADDADFRRWAHRIVSHVEAGRFLSVLRPRMNQSVDSITLKAASVYGPGDEPILLSQHSHAKASWITAVAEELGWRPLLWAYLGLDEWRKEWPPDAQYPPTPPDYQTPTNDWDELTSMILRRPVSQRVPWLVYFQFEEVDFPRVMVALEREARAVAALPPQPIGQESGKPDRTKGGSDSNVSSRVARADLAMQAFIHARPDEPAFVQNTSKPTTSAYEWIKESEPGGYTVPAFGTFARYLRTAHEASTGRRRFAGDKMKTARSVAQHDEVDHPNRGD